MPTLLLMRHAAAAPAAIDGDDHQRPLTEGGRQELQRAAAQLALEALPDRILASPARRTVETARILQQALGLPEHLLRFVDALYLATPASLRRTVREHAGDCVRLLVIGHNPGLSELATQLQQPPRRISLPTSGYCRIELTALEWNRLEST